MRKNKKLFAILTLVAFMMTLMPVLAFGAAATAANLGTPSATNPIQISDAGVITLNAGGSEAGYFSVEKSTGKDTYEITQGTQIIAVGGITASGSYVVAKTGTADSPAASKIDEIPATKVFEVTPAHIDEKRDKAAANGFFTTELSNYKGGKNETNLTALLNKWNNVLTEDQKTIAKAQIDKSNAKDDSTAFELAMKINDSGSLVALKAGSHSHANDKWTDKLAKTVLDNESDLKDALASDGSGYLVDITIIKAAADVVNSWDDVVADADSQAKLEAYQNKDAGITGANASGINNAIDAILGDRLPAEDDAATRIADKAKTTTTTDAKKFWIIMASNTQPMVLLLNQAKKTNLS